MAFLLINFARPDKTEKTIEPILKKESPLYLFCDGPKPQTQEKTHKVQEILKAAKETRKNLGLETHLLFGEKNLGPKEGPLHAITWLFSKEHKGHIIEDDILIAPEFEAAHRRALAEIADKPKIFCVAEGHPLPACPYQWIETKMARLVAWSSSKEKFLPLLEKSRVQPNAWKTRGTGITKNSGLLLKTQIFLWKEFYRLSQNPNWSWHYTLMLAQLEENLLGLTPTTRLHKNLGIDGSGANCINLFGETEDFSEEEISQWSKKKSDPGKDTKAEKTMERQRYGRIHQAIGRKLYTATPTPLKFFWIPPKKC